MRHPLEKMLNADADDILSAIQCGMRAIVDTKGKLAEYFLNRQLKELKEEGFIEDYKWSDKDGQPDFFIEFRGKQIKLECKNIRSGETYKRPPSYKVEVQKTRNSKDGSNTRSYRVEEFDILASCLFNHTQKWEYLFICTPSLEKRPENPKLLKTMHPVPLRPELPWHSSLKAALETAVA